MAITITSDPIIGLQDVKTLIREVDDTEAILLINSVSAQFLRFTNRLRITKGTVSEWAKGGRDKIYLHGSPVDESSTVSAACYGTDGTVATTLTLAAGDLRVVQSPVDAYIELISYVPPWVDGLDTVKISYTGGWTTVPGDIVLAAIDQMRVERMRRDGTLGARSVSANGETVQFEIGGLIRSVADAWEPYRMVV